jgi:RNA polymerase sigma-70 factor, ECF subfamily
VLFPNAGRGFLGYRLKHLWVAQRCDPRLASGLPFCRSVAQAVTFYYPPRPIPRAGDAVQALALELGAGNQGLLVTGGPDTGSKDKGACKERAGKEIAYMDEAELIRAAQAGDRAAFDQLIKSYDQSILRLANNMLRSPEDARDIYQETFLRVYRNLHNFRFDCSFHTWLYRIATNLCLDQLRKRKVRREESPILVTPEGTRDRMDNVPEERADGDPQRNLYSGQIRRRVKEALQQLTPRERMVFELRHYEGLRLRNIGEIVGTTEEAAKNCLFRATQKMRTALGEFA